MPRPRWLAVLLSAAVVGALAIGQPSSAARTTLGGADPSAIKVGGLYVSAKSVDGGVAVRIASTLEGIAAAPEKQVWRDTGGLGEVWAPEIVHHDGSYRNAGQCSGLQAGGEGPRWRGAVRPE